MKPQPRKNYSVDFKREAVQFYLQNDRNLATAADNCGVTKSMLHKWIKKYPSESALDASSQHPLSPEDYIMLQKQIEAVKGEIVSLRKIMSKAFLKRFEDELDQPGFLEDEKFFNIQKHIS